MMALPVADVTDDEYAAAYTVPALLSETVMEMVEDVDEFEDTVTVGYEVVGALVGKPVGA